MGFVRGRKSKTKASAEAIGRKYGYRSGLEKAVQDQLTEKKVAFEYESKKITYIVPQTVHKYTPDFWLPKKDGTNMIVETKGRFVPEDRKKLLLVKEQYPDMDIRILFQNAHTKLTKASKTTYAMWAEKNGFKWAHGKTIPAEWLAEVQP